MTIALYVLAYLTIGFFIAVLGELNLIFDSRGERWCAILFWPAALLYSVMLTLVAGADLLIDRHARWLKDPAEAVAIQIRRFCDREESR